MTAHIWQIKKEQYKKREGFLQDRIFYYLLGLITAFDMDEYSDLRKCLLELAKLQGGELKQDTKWWIQERVRWIQKRAGYIRSENLRNRVFHAVYEER